jgi:cobalamin biosynthesis protein CobT
MYNISYGILFWTSFLISFSDQEPTVVETDVVGPNNSSQLPKQNMKLCTDHAEQMTVRRGRSDPDNTAR